MFNDSQVQSILSLKSLSQWLDFVFLFCCCLHRINMLSFLVVTILNRHTWNIKEDQWKCSIEIQQMVNEDQRYCWSNEIQPRCFFYKCNFMWINRQNKLCIHQICRYCKKSTCSNMRKSEHMMTIIFFMYLISTIDYLRRFQLKRLFFVRSNSFLMINVGDLNKLHRQQCATMIGQTRMDFIQRVSKLS